MRTARRLIGHETVVAVVARLVDVEEGHDVPFLYIVALHGLDRPPRFRDGPHAHVPRNDRIGNAGEFAVVQMHVRPAHLGVHRVQQRRALLELGLGEFADLDRDVRGREDGSLVRRHASSGGRSIMRPPAARVNRYFMTLVVPFYDILRRRARLRLAFCGFPPVEVDFVSVGVCCATVEARYHSVEFDYRLVEFDFSVVGACCATVEADFASIGARCTTVGLE